MPSDRDRVGFTTDLRKTPVILLYGGVFYGSVDVMRSRCVVGHNEIVSPKLQIKFYSRIYDIMHYSCCAFGVIVDIRRR